MQQNPSSHFPSPERSDHIAVCFQQSAYLCSGSIYENQPEFIGTHTVFPLFLDRILCGKMSQWIPVILLSHSQAAGSHGGKLSVQPKSRRGFHHRHLYHELLFKCATEIPYKHLRAGKQTRVCVFQQQMEGLTFSSWHKNTYSITFFFKFLFLNSIFHWTWDHRGALRWTNQMDFYLRSGIQRLQWGKTLRVKITLSCLWFLWADGNISSPVHWWERIQLLNLPTFKDKQGGSENYTEPKTKHPTMRAMRTHWARTVVPKTTVRHIVCTVSDFWVQPFFLGFRC